MRPFHAMSRPRSDPEPLRAADGADVGALAQAYGRLVFHAAWRVLGDHARAEEVQQDVFVRLLERPPAQVDNWPAFLTTLAMRLAIDRQRRRQRWQRLLPLWRHSAPASAPSAELELQGSQAAAHLRAELGQLGRREAECFVLRHLQGLDIAAIAAAIGITSNHVSVCLHRARRSLEARLADPSRTEESR